MAEPTGHGAFRSRRAAQIARRGLGSWPSDNAEDQLRIEGVSMLLEQLDGALTLKLPGRDLVVPVDASMPASLVWYLAIGDYEAQDLDFARDHVATGDRAMELGGGIGVTGAALGRASGNPVVIVEPNWQLYPAIRRTFAANHLDLVLIEAAASRETMAGAQLAVAGNYWWSRLLGEADGAQDTGTTVAVPTLALEELVEIHQPTVLAIDIEGHETTLVGLDIAPVVRTMLFEIHTPDIGSEATAEIVRWVEDQGFRLLNLRGNSWAFRRP